MLSDAHCRSVARGLWLLISIACCACLAGFVKLPRQLVHNGKNMRSDIPDSEWQRADPVVRRRALKRWIPSALAGLLLVIGLSSLADRNDVEHALPLLYAMLALLFSISLVILWPIRRLWLIGRDADQTRRFPPPGLAVIRDTRVFHGEAAQLRGRLLQALASVMGFFVVLTPLAMMWLVLSLTYPVGRY
jgi:hypothetical protein